MISHFGGSDFFRFAFTFYPRQFFYVSCSWIFFLIICVIFTLHATKLVEQRNEIFTGQEEGKKYTKIMFPFHLIQKFKEISVWNRRYKRSL